MQNRHLDDEPSSHLITTYRVYEFQHSREEIIDYCRQRLVHHRFHRHMCHALEYPVRFRNRQTSQFDLELIVDDKLRDQLSLQAITLVRSIAPGESPLHVQSQTCTRKTSTSK